MWSVLLILLFASQSLAHEFPRCTCCNLALQQVITPSRCFDYGYRVPDANGRCLIRQEETICELAVRFCEDACNRETNPFDCDETTCNTVVQTCTDLNPFDFSENADCETYAQMCAAFACTTNGVVNFDCFVRTCSPIVSACNAFPFLP